MTAPDFDALELRVARAHARDAYRQAEEAERKLETVTAALRNLEINGGCFCGKGIPDDLHAAYCVEARAASAPPSCACGRTADGLHEGERICIVCLAERKAEAAGAV